MADFRFELNRAGVRELLLSQGVADLLEDTAQGRLPPGCRTDPQAGRNRRNVRIVTETAEAYRDNLENNTLLKAIGGKGGSQ
jgi:hypothetical protein